MLHMIMIRPLVTCQNADTCLFVYSTPSPRCAIIVTLVTNISGHNDSPARLRGLLTLWLGRGAARVCSGVRWGTNVCEIFNTT